MKLRILLTTVALLCALIHPWAQDELQLRHIRTKGNVVKVVCSDAQGIVWLGTSSGLFSLPQLESRNPDSYQRPFPEANTSITRLCCDEQGRLWIRTLMGKVFLYDPQHSQLTEDTQTLLASRGIPVRGDFHIITDEDGNWWVAESNQLHWLEGGTGAVHSFRAAEEDRVMSVCHNDSLAAFQTERELCLFSLRDKAVVRRVPLPEGYQGSRYMMMTAEGKVYVWKSAELYCYDYAAGQWSEARTMPSYVTGVALDQRQRTWVSTQATGIFVYAPDGRQLHHLQHHAWDANSLQSDHVDMLHFERGTQTMWVAYAKGGLSVCSSRQENFLLRTIMDPEDRDATTDVLTFAPATQQGAMWVGLENRGVYLVGAQGAEHIVPEGFTTALHTAADGSLWAGFYLGGLLHRTADGHTARYLDGRSPYAIAEDEDGSLYLALLGQGVWHLNPRSGEAEDTHLTPKYAFDLKMHRRKLYAATTEGFFRRDADGAWEQVCKGSFHNVLIDAQDYIWLLGSEGRKGLTLFAPDGTPAAVPEDLKSAPLKNISMDRDGNVWIASPTELMRLRHDTEHPERLERSSFNIRSTEQEVFYNYHASEIDDDGCLWLGTTAGYQRIDTRGLLARTQQEATARRLVLGAVSVNDRQLSPGMPLNGREVLQSDIVYARELNLRHDENNLVIECSAPYAEGFDADQYYYQLRGLSDAWYPIKEMTIVLPNLPAGTYELFTRTQSAEPCQLLALHIAPPFWRSWWGWSGYLLMVAAAAYALFRYYRNKRAYRAQLRELQMQQQQQQQMNEMKLRFFTNISHDLRTPLSLIIGPVQELMGTIRDPEAAGTLQMVHRNASQLLALVNQILDFRRLEFGRERLVPAYGDIVALIGDICASFRLKAEKEQIRFTFTPAVEKVETVFDRDKTTKIMMNLLSNAFKFTRSGGAVGVTLDISDGQIIISVADTGMGIPDADKEHIFERFYQSETATRATAGSGIGLHIVREYVRLQGGEISVCDPPSGQGSVFRFNIPLRKQEPTQPAPQATAPAKAAATTDTANGEPASGRTTLLIVDDNVDLLSYISRSLGRDYAILTATNGQEAIEVLQRSDVDIIVSDVLMPEVSGLELCQRVKSDIETSHIPVVLLTAKTMTSDELKGLEAGADDYITKPFSMEILRQRIHNLLERGRDRHQRFAQEMNIEPSEITVTSLDEQFIARAIALVEQHISEPDYSVEQLSAEMGVHRAQLYKKLLHLTGKTPQLFIRILRLKRGRQLLLQSGLYVSEVAYKVGFNSPRNFSRYFKEEFGMTPKEFVNQQ
ncbi:MAG: response regulator [Bacteroidaceae bacterium]|nr:response regulator [Bacteroidaceae bacterium]MBR0244543.1 response regulator [Bacteroidaceae bacterium]